MSDPASGLPCRFALFLRFRELRVSEAVYARVAWSPFPTGSGDNIVPQLLIVAETGASERPAIPVELATEIDLVGDAGTSEMERRSTKCLPHRSADRGVA